MVIAVFAICLLGILTVMLTVQAVIRENADSERRSMSLELIAKRANLQFQRCDAHAYADLCSDFQLVSNTHGNYNNSVFGKYQGFHVAVFDYFYETGSDSSSSTNQTVFMIHSEEVDLPCFQINPKGLIESIAATLGSPHVRFENDSEFSQAFYLKTSNKSDVTALFDQGLRDFLLGKPNVSCEANGGTFIWYRHAKVIGAEQFDQFRQEGFDAYQRIADRVAPASSPSRAEKPPLIAIHP